jgi:hypothetical protein
MDIRAKYVLGMIRKIEGAEESILAGGAVRDAYFNKEPKDYDYFVPSPVWEEVIDVLDKNGKGKILQEKWVDELSREEKDAYQKNGHLTGVYDVEIEGLRCQIIGHKSSTSKRKEEGEFATEVLKYFDYGVNMIYFDGGAMLRDTEDFQNDVNNGTLTLHNIKTMDHLPGHMEKFLRLREKLPGEWVFRCPALTLKDEKKEDFSWLNHGYKKVSEKKYKLADLVWKDDRWDLGNVQDAAPQGIQAVAPAQWNVDPAPEVNDIVNDAIIAGVGIMDNQGRRVDPFEVNIERVPVGNHIFRN